MKILYAIQGTGNGHLSRAKAIIPHLKTYGDVDILVSGIQADISLPHRIKYRYRGMSFIFGKKGGVDIMGTYKKTKLKQFWKEVNSLPIEEYDLILNDFEPVSAWACQRGKKPCIGLSNQLASLTPEAPQPKHEDIMGKFILRFYAPVTSVYGIHFKRYNNRIFTPIIRSEVRELEVSDKGHYTVYLPAYGDDRIVEVLRHFEDVKWEVFSKHNKTGFRQDNINLSPIDEKLFLKSLASCSGVLCAAGFGTPSEALFLGKKLLVIPMKRQYEQHCNAAALREMGVSVIKSLKTKHGDKIEKWLREGKAVEVDYPEVAGEIVEKIMADHALQTELVTKSQSQGQFGNFFG